MKIKQYKNLKKAIEDITKESKDYVFVRHTLNAGKEIKLHYHSKANEFVVLDSGELTIRVEGEEKTFNLKNQATIVVFPKGKKHSLRALAKISYFVIRDVEDDIIYCKE